MPATTVRRLSLLSAFLLCLLPGVAQAAASCTAAATTIAFATINPFGAPVTSNGTITVACSGGTTGATYTIALSKGSGTFATRTMKSGANALNYNLYTTSALSTIWGDGTGGTSTVTGTNTKITSLFTVYGRLPTPQGVSPAVYSDTITVTVTY